MLDIQTIRDDHVSDTPVKSVQCINVRHIVSWKNEGRDTHIVRQKVYYEDGKVGTRIEAWYNYERPFYITKKSCRRYKQKKAREKIENLEKYMCTDSNLTNTVKRKLGSHAHGLNAMAKETPYLYGSNESAASMIKAEINGRITDPDFVPVPSSYTAFDIETDVYRGDGHNPVLITIANDQKHVTMVADPDMNNRIDYVKFDEMCKEYFPGWTVETQAADTVPDLIDKGFHAVNKYDTDYCGVWNIAFDLPKIKKSLEFHNRDMESSMHGFGDWIRPYYNFWKGNDTKRMASGKTRKLALSEIWNSVTSTSRPEWIDAMVMVRVRRMGFGEIPGGYNINNILRHFIKKGKLKVVSQLDMLSALEWHVAMQRDYPTEYAIYALYDVIGMQELEADTGDITKFLQDFSTPTSKVNKSSSTSDDVFAVVNEEDGYINCHYALTEELEEREENMYGLSKWIAILPSYMMQARPLSGKFFKKIISTLINSISTFVQDNDLVSAYPRQIIATNASLATTVFEWFKKQPNIIMGELERRKALMNRPTGVAGMQAIATGFLRLPDWDKVDEIMERKTHETNYEQQ